jgi:hypothetical protein
MNEMDGQAREGSRRVWEHTSQQDVARVKCPVVHSIGHFVLSLNPGSAHDNLGNTGRCPVRRQSLSTNPHLDAEVAVADPERLWSDVKSLQISEKQLR